MFNKALAFAVTAACLTAGAAHAQSYDNRYDQRAQHSDRSGYYNDGQRGDRGYRNDRRDDRDDRYYGRRDNRYEARHDGRYDNRDYGYRNNGYNDSYRHHMRRGERLSQQYYGRQYVVSDWRGHRGLYAPQRGYHWVQVGSDYALVAIATGLIAHVLLN